MVEILKWLHQNGIISRDFSLNNFFITKEKVNDREKTDIVLGDMFFAKLLNGS